MNDIPIKDRSEAPPGAIDELTLQNTIRSRHKQDWPNVILQLTKRVQAVNQTWAKIMSQVMTIPGLRITWENFAGKLAVRVTIGDEHELHDFTDVEVQEAQQYIEVLLMDRLDHSKLIAKHTR